MNNSMYLSSIVGFTRAEKIAEEEKSEESAPLISGSAVVAPQANIDPSILRIGCGSCYWESVSGINPTDENFGYLIGAGLNNFVQTTDGWETSTTFQIDDLANHPITRGYILDPKLTFSEDGRLIVVSLLGSKSGNPPEPITGGIWKDSAPKNIPPQFTQTLLTPIPPNWDMTVPGHGIIYDYGKISVDIYPESVNHGNTYVFAARALFEDGSIGPGLFIIDPNGQITLKSTGPSGIHFAHSTVVGPDGTLYVAGSFPNPSGFGSSPVMVAVSSNAGQTFTRHNVDVNIHHSLRNCEARTSTISDRAWFIYRGPELAVNKNGVLYAVWSLPKECVDDSNFEFDQYGRDWDVYVSFSTDQGTSWSNPVRVNDDTTGGDQGFASIAIDEDGTVYVAFLDHRNDQDKAQFDVYIAESTDGGISFSKNLKVNDISVPNVFGHRDPGDYLNMVSVGDTKVFVSHPCVNTDFNQEGKPSDACVAKYQKPLIPSCQRLTDKIQASMAKVCGAPGFDEVADVNNDKVVDGLDLDIVSNNNEAWCTDKLNNPVNPCQVPPEEQFHSVSVIMRKQDGTCAACGPADSGEWGCVSIQCPS